MSRKTGKTPSTHHADELKDLLREMIIIRDHLLEEEARRMASLQGIHPSHRQGAANLIHYCTLRTHDLRSIQPRLTALGLSSLAMVEPHVLANLEAVIKMLALLGGESYQARHSDLAPHSMGEGSRDLIDHVMELFGPTHHSRQTRIMVTMAATDSSDFVIRQLVEKGLDCLRINTAHDSLPDWLRAMEVVRESGQQRQRPCRILIDLAGPKLRIGSFETGPEVVKVRPTRDEWGRVVKPASICFYTSSNPPSSLPEPVDAWLPVNSLHAWQYSVGDRLKVYDTRGRKRTLTIVEASADRLVATSDRTIYFASGMAVEIWSSEASIHHALGEFHIADLPALERVIHVSEGDIIRISGGDHNPPMGDAEHPSGSVRSEEPGFHRLTCSLPEIIHDVRTDETIWFDDGRVGGTILARNEDSFDVRVTHVPHSRSKLAGAKGINLPDSHLHLPALTPGDLAVLDRVVSQADLVGLSFIRSPEDVENLVDQLKTRDAHHLGIVLKIETRQAFDHLPQILLTALQWPRVAVMIARGDLAVEVGFDRLAEVQEEIMWLCEAAHIPVIWATQVLESMAKFGAPSRAEITDAATSERADCVMLNKGPHIVETMCYLDGILCRVQRNALKKGYILRPLEVARRFLDKT